MVLTMSKAAPPGQLSTMQISKGCKRHEETFLTTIHEVNDRKDARAGQNTRSDPIRFNPKNIGFGSNRIVNKI